MSKFTVDTKSRIVLPRSRPGDVFTIQQVGDGRYLLVRVDEPETARRLTREECVEAMHRAPLRPTMGWQQLRERTREP